MNVSCVCVCGVRRVCSGCLPPLARSPPRCGSNIRFGETENSEYRIGYGLVTHEPPRHTRYGWRGATLYSLAHFTRMAWLWGARRAAKRARLPNTQTTSSPCLDGDRPAARYVGPLLDDLSKVVVLRREAEPLPHRVAGRHPRGRAGELDACRRAERGLSEPSQARFRPPSRHASLDGALHAPLQRGGGGRPDRSLASGRRRGPVRCRRRARCREGGVRGGDLPQRPVRSVDTRGHGGRARCASAETEAAHALSCR